MATGTIHGAMDEAFALRIRRVLAAERERGGHRLGVIVADDDDAAVRDGTALLEATGLLPARRLARLRPRIGDDRLVPGDVTDFVRRFGHEYAAALMRRGDFPDPAERTAFEAVCQQEGCDIDWR